jgi:two-component system, chemotaxis family, protein-glutamate methylesterase/glutaminase
MLGGMSGRRHTGGIELVVMLGSQGALPIARSLVSALPEDFPAAVVYVQHRMKTAGSILASVLRFHARLPVHEVGHGDAVRAGAVHVPAPDVVTTIRADRTFAVAEGGCTGDPLMASAAAVYGPATLGVILSGRLRAGAAGLSQIKGAGGRALIQAPESAAADGMPLAGMATGCYDFVLPPRQLGAALLALVTVPGAADLFRVRTHPESAVSGLWSAG